MYALSQFWQGIEFTRSHYNCLAEHKKDVNTHQLKNYTRSERAASLSDYNKSGITDHSVQQNHMIDWEEAKAADRESHLRTRQVKEVIQIRKHPTTMNRDELLAKRSSRVVFSLLVVK